MKTLITYYSYSGNTEKVVNIFTGVLRQNGQADVQRLKPRDEINTFLGQCRAARLHEKAILQDGIVFDAASYDLIIIGCPVWAFAPVPAMNAYLDRLSGLAGKKAIVLLTSGSGLGVKHCFKNIRAVLEKKGISHIDEINIPDRKQHDKGFIEESIRSIL